jgi:Na+/proline symporter
MSGELHWADWLVFGIFIVTTTSVGIAIGIINRKKSTSKEFLQAGSEMHFFPVAMSLQASFLSAIFVVSLPAESYNFGIGYVYLGFSYFIAFPLIGKLFLPVYFQLNLSSAYEVR